MSSRLRPARQELPFLPYTDWIPGQSYICRIATLSHTLRFTMEIDL